MFIESGERAYGRAQAFRQVTDGIGKAREGYGSALVVTGPPRTGRSHFMDDVTWMHVGPTVFIAGARQNDLARVTVFHPLFTHLGVSATEIAALSAMDIEMAGHEWATAVGDVILRALASRDFKNDALLIVVDDADLMPASCRSVLGYVARGLANLPVFSILVCGEGEVEFRSLPQLPIYTLTLAESGDLVESFIGHRPPLDTLTELHRSCRGNPVDLRELCEQASVEQLRGIAVLPWPVAVAPSRMNRWREVFSQITEFQRLALLTMSVAQTLEPDHLLRILDATAERPCGVEQLADLVESGYLSSAAHEVCIANNLDRAAIYQIAPSTLRAACHQQLSACAVFQRRPVFGAAVQLMASSPATEPVEVALGLIGELEREGDVPLVLQILRTLVGTSPDASAARLAVRGVEIAMAGGYFCDVDWFAQQSERHELSPAESGTVATLRMQIRFLLDEPLDGELMRHIVSELSDRSPDAAADLSNTTALFHLFRYEEAEARQVLSLVGAPSTRRVALSAMVSHRMAQDEVDSGSPYPLPKLDLRQPLEFRLVSETATFLSQVGRFQEAATLFDRLLHHMSAPLEQVVSLTLQVDNEMFSGTVDAAQQMWDEAQRLLPMRNFLHLLRLCQGVQLLGLSGRFTDAADLAEVALTHPHRRANPGFESRLLWSLGQIALMKGDADTAISLLEQSIDVLGAATDHWQVQRYVDLVEAQMVAKHPAEAERVLRSLESRTGSRSQPATTNAAIGRGRLLIARTLHEARAALPQALGAGEKFSIPPLERARAHAIYAHRFGWLEDDSTQSSEGHQRKAESLFSRIGAAGWIIGDRWLPHGRAELVENSDISGLRARRHSGNSIVDLSLVNGCANAFSAEEGGVCEPSPGLFEDAVAVISRDYTDPELTVKSLARRLGTSVRTLHRTFEPHSRSVAQMIRSRRIDRAVDLLRDPQHSDLPLAEIARISGAPSVAYLRMGIKETHNVNPSQLRMQAVPRELSGSRATA